MKKNQVNAILVDQTKRKKKIISISCIILALLFIALFSFLLFFHHNKVKYIPYKEDSTINYKVYLKDNNFFKEDYLSENKQYIASIIDKINATFKYSLNIDEDNINYNYEYYIEAEVVVEDSKTKNYLYNYKDTIVSNNIAHSQSKNITIKENIDIDYNKYNELIKRFVSYYDLEDSVATLNINMYVKVLGDCETIEDANKNSVFSLKMPLTEKTISIDVEKDLIDSNKEQFMACTNKNNFIYLYLVIGFILLFVSIFMIYNLIKYIIKTRTAETIYQKELSYILNNFKSYIQKVNNTFDIKDYRPLYIDTFTDMLEIRDTVNQPILMVENKFNTGVYFIIPTNTKILYIYSLKISDIKKQIKENSI